jgi:hypothetical protein
VFANRTSVTAAAIFAVAVAGCGVGAGDSRPGEATLSVTRDYGVEPLVEATLEQPRAADTVVRFLDREAEIETDYGGNFVTSIEGISGDVEGGRTRDWFFYVNGYWSPIGAGEAVVRPGDQIWWDYRDWSDAYRVPAVVGSWPEPFLNGFDGRQFAVEVVCFEVDEVCEAVSDRLEDEGVEAIAVTDPGQASDPDGTLRILVGRWARVRADRAARLLEDGPGTSGVYASPRRCDGGWGLTVLSDRAEELYSVGGAGWVAAVRRGEEQPTWIVSGGERASVEAAAELLEGSTLADHYAIATSDGQTLRIPASGGGPPIGQGSCA